MESETTCPAESTAGRPVELSEINIMQTMIENKGFRADTVGLRPASGAVRPLKVYMETYGCQMNVNDSEVVVSILSGEGYGVTAKLSEADLALINTCSVRENAEQRVRGRLDVFRMEKKKRPELLVGVIGCMAERLKNRRKRTVL